MAERTYMTAKNKRDASRNKKIADAQSKVDAANAMEDKKGLFGMGGFEKRQAQAKANRAMNDAKKVSDFDKGRNKAIEILGE